MIDPNGNIAQNVDESGAYIAVPVPPGTNGKAWHFASPPGMPQDFGLDQFNFFNLPNVLSPSPARMVLSKDDVRKDGLRKWK